MRTAAELVCRSRHHLQNDSRTEHRVTISSRAAFNPVWPGDEAPGSEVGVGLLTSSQGAGGTAQWIVSGPPGQRIAPGRDKRFGGSQYLFGRKLSTPSSISA